MLRSGYRLKNLQSVNIPGAAVYALELPSTRCSVETRALPAKRDHLPKRQRGIFDFKTVGAIVDRLRDQRSHLQKVGVADKSGSATISRVLNPMGIK